MRAKYVFDIHFNKCVNPFYNDTVKDLLNVDQ